MQLLRLPQLVEKVTLLRATENGCVPIVLFARDKKKRKKKREVAQLISVAYRDSRELGCSFCR